MITPLSIHESVESKRKLGVVLQPLINLGFQRIPLQTGIWSYHVELPKSTMSEHPSMKVVVQIFRVYVLLPYQILVNLRPVLLAARCHLYHDIEKNVSARI